jgi:Asp-tRNA(Asn)/Glu-tRNA(Gln) amidotransferase C subunit
VEEIKNRFEKIYQLISSIERIDEDDVLLYTLRVYFNSLGEKNALDKIGKNLSDKNAIEFIKTFTQSLSVSFENLSTFFRDEQNNFAIHSLITLGSIGVALPFIIKAYQYGLPISNIENLCSSLENLLLRHRLIGTRADITSRIKEVFEEFTKEKNDILSIVDRIEELKTTDDWWLAYWNNDNLKKSLQGDIKHSVAKYLLWKYEVYLEQQGKDGYSPTRFDKIKNPELEHIAPTTEPEKRSHGYGKYDDEFKEQYLNSLGNYLLLSKSHNCAVGNIPLDKKLATYTHNEQQREVKNLVPKNGKWDKKLIKTRKNRIIEAIMNTC